MKILDINCADCVRIRELGSEETLNFRENRKKKMKDKQLVTIIFFSYWHSGVVVFYFLFYFLFLPVFIRPQDLVVCMMGKEVLSFQMKSKECSQGKAAGSGYEVFEMLDPQLLPVCAELSFPSCFSCLG